MDSFFLYCGLEQMSDIMREKRIGPDEFTAEEWREVKDRTEQTRKPVKIKQRWEYTLDPQLKFGPWVAGTCALSLAKCPNYFLSLLFSLCKPDP